MYRYMFVFFGTSWRLVVSCTRRPLYPRERPRGTHWTGGWVGSRAGLERGPLNLVSTIEGLLGRNSSGSGPENREYSRRDPSR
jgi:hypothetical protein